MNGPTPGMSRLPLPPSTPKVRSRRPTPHSRPSITIGVGDGAPRRMWRWVAAHQIQVGDVIPDLGQVSDIVESSFVPPPGTGDTPALVADLVRWTVTIDAGDGHRRTYYAAAEVWCFATAERPPEVTDAV